MIEVFAALGSLALERRSDGRFVVRGGLPSWCSELRRADLRWDGPLVAEELFPYLAVFLPEAEVAWRGERHARADSQFWTEVDRRNGEIHLEATALNVDGAAILVITRSERLFAEEQRLLQRARELRLTHDALMRELEMKDILVHTIVHDLAAPLNSVMGVLSLLSEEPVAPPADQWLRLGLQAATRQRDLIDGILEVYAARGGGEPNLPMKGVDLTEVLAQVAAERLPVARLRGLRLESVPPDGPCLVVGDEMRLFRVLTNLLDNAFRHTPDGGVVRIAARREESDMKVVVEDEGPGVPPEVRPHLFEQRARGGAHAGAGLGLFFCRITVEHWGGAVGYEPRACGGARFWIRLPLLGQRSNHDGEDLVAR